MYRRKLAACGTTGLAVIFMNVHFFLPGSCHAWQPLCWEICDRGEPPLHHQISLEREKDLVGEAEYWEAVALLNATVALVPAGIWPAVVRQELQIKRFLKLVMKVYLLHLSVLKLLPGILCIHNIQITVSVIQRAIVSWEGNPLVTWPVLQKVCRHALFLMGPLWKMSLCCASWNAD